MAKFRKVHTAFWDDLFIEKLSPEDRYFYLFLLTNPLCTECGIYEISPSKICSYTGYNREAVMTILKRFQDSGKLIYNNETFELAIINKMRYLDRLGKPVLDCLKAELKKIKDIELIKIVGQRSDNEQVMLLFNDAYTIREKEKHDTSAKNTRIVFFSEARKEKEEEKEEEENRSKKHTQESILKNSNLNRQPNIPTKDKVWEVFRAAGGTKEMAKSFYEKYEGTGWFLNGSPITNFSSLAIKFIDSWKRNEESKNPNPENTKIKLK